MDKQVSIKNIEKIIKNNKYETSEISYKCGEDEVIITVNPCAAFSAWYRSIEMASAMLVDEDDKFIPSLISASYGIAVIACFTNIKTDNIDRVIDLITYTDIVSRIVEVLPNNVVKNFEKDFEASVAYKKDEVSPIGRFSRTIDMIGSFSDNLASSIQENPTEFLKILNNDDENN